MLQELAVRIRADLLEPAYRRWLLAALIILCIAVFVLNRGHQMEQGVYIDQLVPYAEHIAGNGE